MYQGEDVDRAKPSPSHIDPGCASVSPVVVVSMPGRQIRCIPCVPHLAKQTTLAVNGDFLTRITCRNPIFSSTPAAGARNTSRSKHCGPPLSRSTAFGVIHRLTPLIRPQSAARSILEIILAGIRAGLATFSPPLDSAATDIARKDSAATS
jgi:hypothetical protein